MFTGIIEEVGIIAAVGGDGLSVYAEKILQGVAIGDSIAVDGICLTVTHYERDRFSVGLSPETIERTTLLRRSPGDPVNLESALRAGGKLGGHFVSGHIDGVGSCLASSQSGTAWEIDFEAPPAVSRYIVEKGSIAINGISLTVAACNPAGDWFRVAVIPHSFSETTLGFLQPGDPVNLEADIIGKYVEKLLGGHSGQDHRQPEVSLAFLSEHGFL
ncbi:riboflavin synthase [Gloeobacter kilaueensis]|uniref:Riboflavin synthase n=1 Tax=Gloeobacter kilaueensis (strain ATCC BAA-2537 / CCAP 1431/1 / ULC 316 / JS1) TaxID=1183438 RepID=U5QDR7_GLOK1|nr:riboflavin synthase [Gloeobacter kilaueensis]AGY57056.1 riboflavin synthase subunit alpha [Gloeobacter kilaueensis JS1]